MITYLDIDTWERKPQFDFFKEFEEPFFGVSLEVDCTTAYQFVKENNLSFFAWYMHQSIKAVNQIDNFRYRIDDVGRVEIHDTIHSSTTISRPDHTFGYSWIEYHDDFGLWSTHLRDEKQRIYKEKQLMPNTSGRNVIHYTTLPWIRFTSMSHARKYSINDSVPKIAFGKLTFEEDKYVLPTSIHVHHALADGYHVNLYVALFQHLLNTPNLD